MKRLLVVVALLVAVATLPGCSSSGICDAVRNGQDPVAAAGSYSLAGSAEQKREQAEQFREAAEEIRSSCPEQSNAAARLDGVASTLSG